MTSTMAFASVVAFVFAGVLGPVAAHAQPRPTGGVRAMALEILHEWHLARSLAAFDQWLAHGAPSDDHQAAGL